MRQLPKAETPVPALDEGYHDEKYIDVTNHTVGGGETEDEEGVGWVKRLFAPVKEQLYFVMAYNLTLREYIVSVTRALAAAGV